MVTTLRDDISTTVPVIVAREIQMYTMPNLEFWARINHHERESFDVGDTLQIPTYLTRPTVDQLNTELDGQAAELTPLVGTYNAQTTGSVNIFIQQWHHVGIELSSYAEAVSQADLSGLFKTAGLDSLAVQIDTSVSALATGFVTNTQGTLGTPLTDDLIVDGNTDLDTAEAPSGPRSFVFSEVEKGNYLKIDKYVNSLYRGDTTPLTRGEIGSLYGQDWAWSTNVTSPSGGQGENLMFHPDAIGGVMRREPVVKAADVEDPLLSTRIIAMAIWGVNETRDAFATLMNGLG